MNNDELIVTLTFSYKSDYNLATKSLDKLGFSCHFPR